MNVREAVKRYKRFGRPAAFLAVLFVLAASGAALVYTIPHSPAQLEDSLLYPKQLRTDYAALVHEARLFEDAQSKAGAKLVTDADLQAKISRIQMDAASGKYRTASSDIKTLRATIAEWNKQLAVRKTQPATALAGSPTGAQIPILLYHYTPGNFEQQLVHLEQRGYTVISLDEAVAGLHGGPLPTKPAVITFDDGFSNQMKAFEALKRHNMKATFYIITSGEQSQWCIGSGRRYHDPLQPPQGCGDAYLNWDQVRELDRSGLITIAAHTVNHRNLAALSADEQKYEIFEGKAALERQVGHEVKHLAYPYGAYNATSIELARQAGFISATTTVPGSFQPPESDFTLRRVRDTLTLP